MDQQDSNSNKENQSCSSSDSNPCPICLAPFLQESYLDTCFHKFCYKCILQWTKVVSRKESRRPSSVKCPLCKTDNFSLIYGYDGSSFQRHYVNQGFEDSSFFSKAHKYRLQCYYTEPGILNDTINVSRYWKLCKYLQPNRWLQSWLRREVQALLQEEDIEVILYHILGTVNSFFSRFEH
ncbi:E3 ubiquitin-protein ligase Topors-like isoform X3 [Populus alba x Populus x berolinensis]|nr:E3 ubiquitin-protein ligase Topors-like isoform X3 [Populus alba x Populus x berolinensis]